MQKNQTILILPFKLKGKYLIKAILAVLKADDPDRFLVTKQKVMEASGYTRRTYEIKQNARIYDHAGFKKEELTRIAKALKLPKKHLINYSPFLPTVLESEGISS